MAPRRRSGLGELNFWWIFFSSVAGSMSFVSLLQAYFKIGLAPIMAQFLNYYRTWLYPCFELIGQFFPFAIPGWYKDLFLISFIFSITYCRAILRNIFAPVSPDVTFRANLVANLVFYSIGVFFTSILSVTLLGTLTPILALLNYRKARRQGSEGPGIQMEASIVKTYYKSLFCMAVIAFLFFATNVQLLS